jgi:hypothetical protein
MVLNETVYREYKVIRQWCLAYIFAAFSHSANYITDITVMSYSAVSYRSVKIPNTRCLLIAQNLQD